MTALRSGVIMVGGEVVGFSFSDITDAASDVADAAVDVVTDPLGAARDLLDAIEDAANALAEQLPDALKPFAYGVAAVAKAADTLGIGTATDLLRIAEQIPWAEINATLQAGVSIVPVLGTAVSDVLAAAEIAINAWQALGSGEWLKFAIETAYKFALANIPGAASLRLVLDPTVGALLRIVAGGESPTSALMHSIVDAVPDAPKIGHLSPRSIAASLAQIVIEHKGLADVGLDLAAEAAGAAGPVVERAVRTAETMLEKGFDPLTALTIALDAAPVPPGLREAVEDLQAKIKEAPDLIPEEIAALGAQRLPGVWDAVRVTHGDIAATTVDRLTDMMRRGKNAAQALTIENRLHPYQLPLGPLPPGAAALDYTLAMSARPSVVPGTQPARRGTPTQTFVAPPAPAPTTKPTKITKLTRLTKS